MYKSIIPERFKKRADYALDHLFSYFEIPYENFEFIYGSKGKYPISFMEYHEEEYELLEKGVAPKIVWYEKMPFFFLKDPSSKDIVLSTFILLSGYQEHTTDKRDKHGRYPYSESLQSRGDFVLRPIIQEYAVHILEQLEIMGLKGIRINDEYKKNNIILSHDIDTLNQWKNNKDALGRIWDLITRRVKYNWGAFRQVLIYLLRKRDPNDTINRIMKMEKKYYKNSIFFFLTEFRSKYDGDYEGNYPKLYSRMKGIMKDGFQIGLHGSYNSWKNGGMLKKERLRLGKNIARDITSIRQHYLRVHRSTTGNQAEAGFKFDYSHGFPEMSGFRNGTCRPFHAWDWAADSASSITAIPLIVMDRTFIGYQNKMKEEAFPIITKLIDTVKGHKGQCSILWHNDVFNRVKHPGWDKLYEKVLKYIREY